MQQFTVEKQGRRSASSWSERVLFVSTAPSLGLVALTRHGHPEAGIHRTLRVSRVQLWPHYKSGLIKEKPNSAPAMLTVRIKGDYVRAGTPQPTATTEGDTPAVTRYIQRCTHEDEATWVIRFRAFGDLEAASRLLARVKPVHYSAALEAAKQRARTVARASAAAHQRAEERGKTSSKSASSGGPSSNAKRESSLQEGSTSTQQPPVTSVVDSDVSDDLEAIRANLVDARRGAAPASA